MRPFLALILLLCAPPLVAGKIYKYIDGNGVVTYTNIKPAHRNYAVVNLKCRNCGWRRQVDWENVPLELAAFGPEISAAARRHGLRESLLRAVIHAESSFRPEVVSDMGAQGLMQLMPATAARFGVGSPFDPAQNILGGAAYLDFLMERFNGRLKLVAAAYNAGENAVARFGGVPPYEETRNFVTRVELLERRYDRALARNPGGGAASPVAPR